MGKQRRERNSCPTCGTIVENLRSTFCSIKCQMASYRISYIKRWKQGLETGCVKRDGEISYHIRRYLLERSKNSCEKCGWNEINPKTGKTPVTIHHIDGNWQNNSETNLIVLCPNCHSLTENYGNLNKGFGRKDRIMGV